MRAIGGLVVALAVLAAAGSVAPAAAQDPLRYVALGDSYTSGPLVLPHDTTWVPEDCGQSVSNYPHLAAQQLGLELVDVSCGSATIDDFAEAQDGLPLGGVNAPQYDALDDTVDIVTVGIGGNDVGFVGLALGCIRLDPTQAPCSPAYTAGGVDTVSAAIADMEQELEDALVEIHRLAPNARVFVVSYPDALPDDGVACYPYVPVLPADMPYLTAKFKEMNAALATAAAAQDATYVDIYTAGIGHDACQPPALAWVNALVVVPPSYPAHPNLLSYLSSGPIVAPAIAAGPSAPSGPSGPTTSTTVATGPTVTVAAAPTVRSGTSGSTLARTGGAAFPACAAALVAVALVARRKSRTPVDRVPVRSSSR